MSLQSEFELPIFAADKAEKENAIARMNSDFLAGRIKVVTLGGVNEELIKEWERLTWNKKKLEEDGVLKMDEKFDDHLGHSALYAWRDSLHHHSMVPDLKPEVVDAAARMIRLKKQLRPIARDDEYDIFDRMDEEAEAREIVRKYRAGG
jgi:hypothetical protein